MSKLTLTRKRGDGILIGDDVHVVVKGVVGGRVMLTIDAPREVRVLRDELEVFELAETPTTEQAVA